MLYKHSLLTVHSDIDYCHFYYVLLYKLRFHSLILNEQDDDDDYLRQEGYLFIDICLFVWLLAGLRKKNYEADFIKIRGKGGA